MREHHEMFRAVNEIGSEGLLLSAGLNGMCLGELRPIFNQLRHVHSLFFIQLREELLADREITHDT